MDERFERRRRRLEKAVEEARRRLDALDPDRYPSILAYCRARAVLAARVRRLEALLRPGRGPGPGEP